MNKEKELITTILSQLPKAEQHKNEFYESDAEIIELGSNQIAFTTDGFSAEDLFRDNDPYMLGWNMAVCTISDILASGGDPEFYAHSIVAEKIAWDQNYMKLLAQGVGDVLHRSGTAFIGGDLGTSSNWHYTGICFGNKKKDLTRKGARAGDLIYLTGHIGTGNLEAAIMLYSGHELPAKFTKSHKTYFKLRLKESIIIRDYASCCIDTSDGLFNALNTISEINDVGYEIGNLPYTKEGLIACRLLSKPKTLLLMGECGEYELMFTIKEKDEEEFLNQIYRNKLKVIRIGKIVNDPIRLLHEDGKRFYLDDFNLSARDFENVQDYLNELIKYINRKNKRE